MFVVKWALGPVLCPVKIEHPLFFCLLFCLLFCVSWGAVSPPFGRGGRFGRWAPFGPLLGRGGPGSHGDFGTNVGWSLFYLKNNQKED